MQVITIVIMTVTKMIAVTPATAAPVVSGKCKYAKISKYSDDI